jgi:tetratricopeptide (TPR) repeat protein
MEAIAREPAKLLREGIELQRQGQLDRAALLYEQALELEPLEADALHLLGVIAHQRGDHAAAVERIRRAIAINSRSPAYHSNLGVAYRSLGRTGEALAAFRRAVELNPTPAGIRFNLGNALKDASEFEQAAAEFRQVLAQEPAHAEAWSGLGDAQRGLGDFAEARRSHDRAIKLAPQSADGHYNLGLALRDEGELSQAVECFLRAACLRPNFFDAHVNLANTYEDLAAFPQAQAAFERALQLKPDAPLVQFNRALARLRQGDLPRGWRDYEWRWRHNGKPRVFSEPEWDGNADSNHTVLVYSEQGIGDEVMFASCFGEVIARSGRCLIECDPRMLRLFARSFPTATFFPRTGQIDPRMSGAPQWNAQIAAGSLPRVLRPEFESFPWHAGYLIADSERVPLWRDRFERLGAGLIVGIAWQGGKDPATRRRRSTTLAQWSSLFRIPGVAFVNLQYGECAAELEQARQDLGANLHDWKDADPLGDLDGPAAQIAALDLVISVDNAAVHLAGALNVPVWTLLPFASDWRWFTDRSDSPWYPRMRLFRQHAAEASPERNWDHVFREVTQALAELASDRAIGDYERGVQLQDNGQLAEAIDCYRRAAALKPDDSRTLNNLGVAWKQGGRPDLAEAAYRAALVAEPQSSTVWFNLANAHREENRLEEAVRCYQQALKAGPHDRDQCHKILVNLSVALKDLHRFSEASDCLERVLVDSPELPAARFDRSLLWLTQGRLDSGWDEYEWRLQAERRASRATPGRQECPFSGRSVRILAEQGIGDQVMFASCLPEVVGSAQSCVVECDPRLVPLFARSFPKVEVVASPSAKPSCQRKSESGADQDERIVGEVTEFIGSLPRYSRRSVEDFPKTSGFLKANPSGVDSWRTRLSRDKGTFKVGIAWRGGKDRETQCKRSIPLELWEAVFQVPGVRFFNLQHGPASAEATLVRQRFGVPLDDGTDCDPLADLDDFAAKIAALDLVISVDNSTVHLAAAIGRPVWTLLPFSADWRWMGEGESTPWYPTMRLLRCRTVSDRPELMGRTARLLTTAAFGG